MVGVYMLQGCLDMVFNMEHNWFYGCCLPVTVDGWIVVPAMGIVVSVPVTVCTVVTLHAEIDTHFSTDLQQNS